MSTMREILNRHASYESYEINGYVFDGESDFREAVIEAVKSGAVDVPISSPTRSFAIDYAGRIMMDGCHIGWLRGDAAYMEKKDFAESIGAELPIAPEYLLLTEQKQQGKVN